MPPPPLTYTPPAACPPQVIVSNWVAHHLHPEGLYEAELDGQYGEECVYLRQARG